MAIPPLAEAARFLCRATPVRRIVRRAKRRHLAILMYHGVTPHPLPVRNWCHMPVAEFAAQMAFLAATYRLLPLSEVTGRMASGGRLPDLTACVTFDDGFRNVSTVAYPVLRMHGIPFTVFITTALADTGAPPWPERLFDAVVRSPRTSLHLGGKEFPLQTPADRAGAYETAVLVLKKLPRAERASMQESLLTDLWERSPDAPPDPTFATLNWDEIARLARDGLAQFGSHTHTHEILTNCTPDEQREELQRSRRILTDRLGSCDILAYPNGESTPAIRALARETGYRAAVTAEHRLNRMDGDLLKLCRLGIGAGRSTEEFDVKLLGY